MIIKNPEKRRDNRSSARQLIDYIENGHGHKNEYRKTRNVEGETLEEITREFEALTSLNVHCRNPLLHAILSWREGEVPAKDQVEEAVTIYLKELEMEQAQVFYALHGNTQNVHVHICINKIDPENYKAIQPAQGWTKKANERAARKIEVAQGWEIEKSGKYVVIDRQVIERKSAARVDSMLTKSRDYENQVGAKSLQRMVREEALYILSSATSWEELHQALALKGFALLQKGSGAVLVMGEAAVKLSAVSQKLSLRKLESRLGSFQTASERIVVQKRDEEPLRQTESLKEYHRLRLSFMKEKMMAWTELKKSIDLRRCDLKREHKKAREKLFFSRSWKGEGSLRNARRSVLAMEQLQERQVLQDDIDRERQVLRKRYCPFPSYETWLHRNDRHDEAEIWRYKNSLPGVLEGESYVKPENKGRWGYQAEMKQQGTSWRVDFVKNGKVCISDFGKRIKVQDIQDHEALTAALKLAMHKWGSVRLYGSDSYKRLILEIAVEQGIQITNEELQSQIQSLKEERAVKRVSAETEQKIRMLRKEFERYHQAVGANRYRVTALRILEDGTKKTAILDRSGGESKGFTPEEVLQKMRWFQSLEEKGENLYFTPLSDSVQHILVDDLTENKMQQMLHDGYCPCVTLLTSPDNYQALIAIPKLEGSLGKQVANDLIRKINKCYGDPKICGAVHPHRVPGCRNMKPKHRTAEGTYPYIQLISTKRGYCEKTTAESLQILKEYREEELKRRETMQSHCESAVSDPLRAYERHAQNILLYQKGDVDWNRIDSMVALRMAVTGWSQDQIQSALLSGAMVLRPIEKQQDHDWDDYSSRTAAWPWSIRGKKESVTWGERYRDHWLKIEGRSEHNRGQSIETVK